LPDGNVVWANRLDLYANGDGGAHWNNRPEAPPFVRSVPMSRKNYQLSAHITLPKPHPDAILQWVELRRSGDTFGGQVQYATHPQGQQGSPVPQVSVYVPWQTELQPDNAVLARTLLVYWAMPNGTVPHPAGAHILPEPETSQLPPSVAPNTAEAKPGIQVYRVILERIRFRKLPERWPNRADIRLFAGVGPDFVFLNELVQKPNPLRQGLGQTRRRNWRMNLEFLAFVPENDSLRITLFGWDADGLDYKFGHLDFNPYAPCCCDTLAQAFARSLVNMRPVGWHGCQDDPLGSIHLFLKPAQITPGQSLRVRSQARRSDDSCPLARRNLTEAMELTYRLEALPLPQLDAQLHQQAAQP
jgi:hypothetical protein